MFLLSRWSGGLVARQGARPPLVVGPSSPPPALRSSRGRGSAGPTGRRSSRRSSSSASGMAVSVAPLTTTVMSAVPRDRAGHRVGRQQRGLARRGAPRRRRLRVRPRPGLQPRARRRLDALTCRQPSAPRSTRSARGSPRPRSPTPRPPRGRRVVRRRLPRRGLDRGRARRRELAQRDGADERGVGSHLRRRKESACRSGPSSGSSSPSPRWRARACTCAARSASARRRTSIRSCCSTTSATTGPRTTSRASRGTRTAASRRSRTCSRAPSSTATAWGTSGAIGAGDIQWMTAGRGIIHQEMPKGDPTGACTASSSGRTCRRR